MIWCGIGTSINDVISTCPGYADDITLLTLSKKGLQKLFDICYGFGIKWRVEFNISKCAIVIFGNYKQPSLCIRQGHSLISESFCEPYLGIILSYKDREIAKYVSDRTMKYIHMLHLSQGISNVRYPWTQWLGNYLLWNSALYS